MVLLPAKVITLDLQDLDVNANKTLLPEIQEKFENERGENRGRVSSKNMKGIKHDVGRRYVP